MKAYINELSGISGKVFSKYRKMAIAWLQEQMPDLPNIVAAFDTTPVIKEEKETVSAQLDASGTDKTSTDLLRASSDSDEKEETPGKETSHEV